MPIVGIPNMLSQLGFSFDIRKAPVTSALTYYVTTPDISAGYATMPNMFRDIPVAPDKIEYGDLSISFKVDEELTNYYEMLEWMKAIGFPNDFTQYERAKFTPANDGVYSDATLIILSNSGRPAIEFMYKKIFPISLSGLTLNSQDNEVDYLSASVNFKVMDFSHKKLG